jgi:hypothetical protein
MVDPLVTPTADDAEKEPGKPGRTVLGLDEGVFLDWMHATGTANTDAVNALVRTSFERLGKTETKDVQQIAASQLELLTAYHQVALGQSNRSFFWALIGSGTDLSLFVVAVVFSLVNGLGLASIVPLIAGAVVNVVSGVVFVLYGKSSSQLSAFHSRLEVLQRYLLANSICESLGDTERDKARAALIGEISRTPPLNDADRPTRQ